MDRRVKYTKMVLNESLLSFVEEKPITKITVTEICKKADVNRSTYYSHFADPFDQFAKLKSEVLQELKEYAEKIDTGHLPSGKRQYKVLKAILQYVEQHRKVFQILLTKSGDYSLQLEIVRFLGQIAFLSAQDLPDQEPEKRVGNRRDYLLLFASNGCFGMFFHWLMDAEPISSDELAHLMADFTRNITF